MNQVGRYRAARAAKNYNYNLHHRFAQNTCFIKHLKLWFRNNKIFCKSLYKAPRLPKTFQFSVQCCVAGSSTMCSQYDNRWLWFGLEKALGCRWMWWHRLTWWWWWWVLEEMQLTHLTGTHHKGSTKSGKGGQAATSKVTKCEFFFKNIAIKGVKLP